MLSAVVLCAIMLCLLCCASQRLFNFYFFEKFEEKVYFKNFFSRFKFNFYVGELFDVTTLLNQSLQHCQSIFPAKKIRDFPAKNKVIFTAKKLGIFPPKIW